MIAGELVQLIAWAYQNCADDEVRQSDNAIAKDMAVELIVSVYQNEEFRAALDERLKHSAVHMLTRELATKAWMVLLLLFELETVLNQPQPERAIVATLIKKIRSALIDKPTDPIAVAIWPYPSIGFTHSQFAEVPIIQRPDLLEKHWPVNQFLLALVVWGIPLDRGESLSVWKHNF